MGEIIAGFTTILVFFGHRMVEDLHTSGWIIIIGLSIVEIFWSMSNVGWSALISDLFANTTRQKIQGQLSSVGGIGRIIGILIGGMLYDGLQLQYMGWGFYEGSLFFIAAGAMFISIIPMFFIPEGGVKTKQLASNTNENLDIHQSNEKGKSTIVFLIFLKSMDP